MTYRATRPRIVEIKDRYRAEAGDEALADEALRATDELLAIVSTLPESEARRIIRLVRDLLEVVEGNLEQEGQPSRGRA